MEESKQIKATETAISDSRPNEMMGYEKRQLKIIALEKAAHCFAKDASMINSSQHSEKDIIKAAKQFYKFLISK